MCGIFGVIQGNKKTIKDVLTKKEFNFFLKHAEVRGRDSSGYVTLDANKLKVTKRDLQLTSVLDYKAIKNSPLCFGHSRLITNGSKDNQPLVISENILIHNGIIVNVDEVFENNDFERKLEIDSEIILAIFNKSRTNGLTIKDSINEIYRLCKGTISSVIYSKSENSLILFSNNGSLYTGILNGSTLFASEEYPLKELGCKEINQVYDPVEINLDLHFDGNSTFIDVDETNTRIKDLIPALGVLNGKEKLLEYKQHNLKRCTKCVLPETMPYINFDSKGVCNYCNNYKIRNNPKPISDLQNILDPYKKSKGNDCIVPLSGGRDSCMGLHLAVKELGMKPVTYTYDWGMVTDLARRNISRFCSELGVENIIVADNIKLKRENVKKNIEAWLKYPDLGMVNLFTAGDKHFFRHVQNIKKQTGIKVDLWSVNPMEVTHFKAGFLGVPPDFEEEKVYSNGVSKQLRYQKLRFKAMLKSPSYFNSTIWDTLQGEYYRSFLEKKDYYHLFDYYTWDENEVNDVIINDYGFEMSPDTSTTWRIGDGTAAFYNYIYYTLAGMSEHDTFRSNQIREGQITRKEALDFIKEENKPRYQNMVWYLEACGLDFETVVKKINSTKKIFQ
jgi:glucosamine--fructose-6-phosphate aminotransferase (isomerizing)